MPFWSRFSSESGHEMNANESSESGVKCTEDSLYKGIMGNHVMQTKIPQTIKGRYEPNTSFYFLCVLFVCFDIFNIIFNEQLYFTGWENIHTNI